MNLFHLRLVSLATKSDLDKSCENWIVGWPNYRHRNWFFFNLCLRLRQFSFHWITNLEVIRGIGSKWNCSDSSDSDSGQILTPLTISIFDFHLVEGALSTATMTKTPSPVKTIRGRKGRRSPKTRTCFRNFERNIM